MLRASKAVRASGSGLSASLRLPPGQIRFVSTKLIQPKFRGKKAATRQTTYQPTDGSWDPQKAMAAEMSENKRKWLLAREKTKFGKLTKKLAELKKNSKPEEPKPVPMTQEQRELLDLIQAPLLTGNDFKNANRNFLNHKLGESSATATTTATGADVSPDSPEAIRAWERSHPDGICDRHVYRARLEDLEELEVAQKCMDPSSGKTPSVFNDRGNNLRRTVTAFFKQRNEDRKGRSNNLPRLQQLNMNARFESLKNLLLKGLEEETQFLIEQEKIYKARLESLSSLSEGQDKLAPADFDHFKKLQLEHAYSQTEIMDVLVEMGHIVASDNFNNLVRPAIMKHMVTDGSDMVHLLNLKHPGAMPVRVKYETFLARQGGNLGFISAAVTDGKRVFVQYRKEVVVYPFYKLSAGDLVELVKNVVISEIARIRKEYGVDEDELLAQLQIMADRGENYLQFYPQKPASEVDEVTGLPIEDESTAAEEDTLEYSFFKIHELEKEKFYATKSAVKLKLGLAEALENDEHFESVADAAQKPTRTSYEEVAAQIDDMRPASVLVARKTWDDITVALENNVLVGDLRTYVRDWSKTNKVRLPSGPLTKPVLLEVLRDTVWKLKLVDSVHDNTVTQTFRLTELQKIFLFKYHFQLVQLWVSRGADVSFSADANDQIEVTGTDKIVKMVNVTLSQFKSRITCVELEMDRSDLKKMTPALWKSLQEYTDTYIENEDGSVLVYHLGNAHKKTELLKRYIQCYSESSGTSPAPSLYQTNSEIVEKSAYFARAVSHELPWYLRHEKKWARWREIHGSDYMVETQEPEVTLTSSGKTETVSADRPLQNIISETLISSLESSAGEVVTQDADEVVESADQRKFDEKTAQKALLNGLVEPFDPAANNVAPTVYEKVSISATLGHMVSPMDSTRGTRGALDLSKKAQKGTHFSGSVPFVNEKLRSMFPKSKPGAQDRYKMIVHCYPVDDTSAPPLQIEAVNMIQDEKKKFKYPPASIYATLRQADLLVSLPSSSSDIKYTARSRQKLLPSHDFLQAWESWFRVSKNPDEFPRDFKININGENTEYRCVYTVYAHHDEYPLMTYDRVNDATAGVVMHKHIAGGVMCGVRNEVSLDTIWRNYKVDTEEESQETSNALLSEFVRNSLKFVDSLDAESIPL
ncbi:hypothetical protein CKK34_3698 [Yarrowia sp. E02]|nr:hypothetical protein CKK34_3698 [Yarrowia sp. E02]